MGVETKYKKKKKLGSYPFASVIFSITLALFVIGIFGLLALHTNKLKEIITENIELQVYLNREVSENDRIRIQKTLSTKEYILNSEENSGITFISKKEAAQQFVEETGEDFVNFLGDNPLRDLYVVKVHPDFHSADQLSSIKSELEKELSVYEVVYAESLIESINENMTKLSLILFGFSTVLLITVVVLINNTIKLALFSQRFLIRSMQLVGATSGFIQKPFLTRAAFYGLLAGFFASACLFGLLSAANANIQDFEQLQDNQRLLMLMGALLLIGVLVGFLSTYRAIKKYLKMSLDELY
jgi:cell division transport system permease protein